MAEPARTIWLLRHAEALAPSPGQSDHDRPLSPRGIQQCEQLLPVLAAAEWRPQWLWVSSAERTRRTAQLLGKALPEAEVVLEPALYLADAEQLLDLLKTTPGEIRSVALIGHNPGISDTLVQLLGKPAAGLATLDCVRLTLRPGLADWHRAADASAIGMQWLRPARNGQR